MSNDVQKEILAQIESANDVASLEALKISAFGKNGQVTALMKELATLSGEAKAIRGKELNILKNDLMSALDSKLDHVRREARATELLNDKGDPTLMSAEKWREGSLHPITRTLQDMTSILGQMGFKLVEGPDIEDDFHNFTALNFPPDHPAREMHDTFYLPDADGQGLDAKRLLRTHTSTMQIRAMQEGEPPFRLMAFGRTYRSDYDQTHTPMFHQMELLVIDKNITMAHMKGTILSFVQNYFGVSDASDDLIRLRPSFFPFTEPSAEVDIKCDKSGDVLKLGEGSDWMEILGCGMVHPNVIKACGLDPEEYQGFAAGMGVERLAMLKYGIPDLRNFFDGDVRWLSHYGFKPLDAA